MSSHSDDIHDKHDHLCDVTLVNEEQVRHVQSKLVDEKELNRVADLFKAFADPTRVKILQALSIAELCVCDISAIVGISQSAISHQLRFLRISRLVKSRKDGKMVYYSLDDDHVRLLLDQGLLHVREEG